MDSSPNSSRKHDWPGVRVFPAILVGALFSVLAPTVARAQFVDPHFWQTDGWVESVALDGQTLYVGGDFRYAGPCTGGSSALGAVDGKPLPNWPRLNGRVNSIVPDGRGGWFLGGGFTLLNGSPRRNLAHLRQDGTPDAWLPDVNNEVRGLAVRGNTVYVCGDFDHVNGAVRNRIAAIDATSGLLRDWHPDVTGSPRVLAIDGNCLYVAGTFTAVSGQARENLAALDPYSGELLPWHPVTDASVFAVLPVGDTLYVGGQFATVGGQARCRIAAIDASTGQVLGWNPTPPSNYTTHVSALAVDGSRLYVGGDFLLMGGVSRSGLAAINRISGAVESWNPVLTTPFPPPRITSIALAPGRVYVAGDFHSVGGQPRVHVAAIDPVSAAPLTWNPGANSTVYCVRTAGDTVLVGGAFTSAGGVPRSCAAAFDIATGEATPWNPVVDNSVLAIKPLGQTVYLGGFFNNVGGLPRSRAAAVKAATGALTGWNPVVSGSVYAIEARGDRVYLGGHFDGIGGQLRSNLAAVDSGTAAPHAWNPAADYDVRALALRGNEVLAGGGFWHIGGQERHGLATLDESTALASAWNPNVGGTVYSIALDTDRLYAAGSFSNVGSVYARNVASVDLESGAAASWAELGSNQIVQAASLEGESLYLGGNFAVFGDRPRRDVTSLDKHTGSVEAWAYDLGNEVHALAVRDGLVYAGGELYDQGVSGLCSVGRFLPQDDAPPLVNVHPPVGNPGLAVGAPAQLIWNATDDFEVRSVDLYISRDGAAGPWTLIASGTPNTGAYSWVPTGPGSGSCFLRVDARDYQGNNSSDISDESFVLESTTAVAPGASAAAFALEPPAPNPTRGIGSLSFTVPHPSQVRLSLLDIQGREVMALADRPFGSGRQTVSFDASALPPGLYFVRMKTADGVLQRRLVISS